MAKDLKFVMLLDCYGELLTEHQRNIMELYYCEDLSLSEIGEPRGITRQAVRALVKRTEKLLIHYEESLGFVERLGKMRECFESLSAAAAGVENNVIRQKIYNEIQRGMSLL